MMFHCTIKIAPSVQFQPIKLARHGRRFYDGRCREVQAPFHNYSAFAQHGLIQSKIICGIHFEYTNHRMSKPLYTTLLLMPVNRCGFGRTRNGQTFGLEYVRLYKKVYTDGVQILLLSNLPL